MNFLKSLFIFLLTVFFIGAVTAYFMGIIPTSLGMHSKIYKSSNIAMDSYDMVNYQTKRIAKRGIESYRAKVGDEHWYFESTANMKLFKARPNKYIPQFGGYCTYTMGSGFTYSPDPNVWYFFKSKLYFFKDEETKKLALADWKNVIEKAKLHWK